MTPGENAFAALLQDYVAECLPLAETVADAFVELERRWQEGDPADDHFAPLKGSLHTIKGNSGMMGLSPVQSLAHGLEDLCALLLAEPRYRLGAADLLVEGGGLLVGQIRAAAVEAVDDNAVQAYLERVGRFRAAPAVPSVDLTVEPRQGNRSRGRRASDLTGEGGVDTVRIDTTRLDLLLEIFGEAMIAHASLKETGRRLVARFGGAEELMVLDRTLLALGQSFKRLEGALMETRLLPISTVFGRFGRMVRDLSKAELKRVRLELGGGETRLDKTVIDRLGEPLVHLMSNAIIHGIEPTEERARLGKPPEATIALRAIPHSNRVIVTITDDGRGLDQDKILRKARALGVNPVNPSVEEVYALAFLPGLSTTERVSETAGRGVGLDVVANSIRALGGQVEVRSAPGRGTRFTLTLPLTVAIVRALVLEVDRERYALPLSDVGETIRVTPQSIHELDQRRMTVWRGQVIPVSDTGELLGGQGSRERGYCVVVRSGGKPRGLLVDRLRGQYDVVVKALDPAVGRPGIISGATILGDGSVACIIDTARLADQSLLERASAPAGSH